MHPTGHIKNTTSCGKDKLSDSYAKYYSPAEHFAFDEIIVLFEGAIYFETIPEKHKQFGITSCVSLRYFRHTYSTTVFKQRRKWVTPSMTTICVNVTGLPARTENEGHKLYMDSSSPALLDDLHTKTVKCCGLLDQTQK
jgi:hypothetical protein